jgi:hypothetical protein
MLAASAAALPALLATAGCRSSQLFAGPDPLAGPPSPSPEVITLQAVISAEQAMIRLYQAALGSGLRRGILADLLAQHRQHLGRLQARLVVPAGTVVPSETVAPSGTATAHRSPSTGPGRVTIARLRAAERTSATTLVRRLSTVEPSLAQLFASIAASDATHAVALGG